MKRAFRGYSSCFTNAHTFSALSNGVVGLIRFPIAMRRGAGGVEENRKKQQQEQQQQAIRSVQLNRRMCLVLLRFVVMYIFSYCCCCCLFLFLAVAQLHFAYFSLLRQRLRSSAGTPLSRRRTRYVFDIRFAAANCAVIWLAFVARDLWYSGMKLVKI